MRWAWEVQPKGFLRIARPMIAWMGKHHEEAIWGNLQRLLEGTDPNVERNDVRSNRPFSPHPLPDLRA